MKFNIFIYIILGMTLLGISIGYVLGYYIHKHTFYNYWFYLSVPIFIVASILIIYGSLFIKDK